MDQDRIQGAATELGGNIKSAVGDITGDTKTQAEGTIDQVTGAAQRTYGKIKDRVGNGQFGEQIDEASAYLGDTVAERPLTSLLVAGAVGYVLAMLTRK